MKLAKAAARAILPEFLFYRIAAVRSRRFQLKALRREGLLDAAASYVERNGCIVRFGPFTGMIYPRDAALSRHSIPKLLGTYEQELHPVLDTIAHRRYDLVIDIGSAEGYYAVGLARLLGTHVLAYDPEPIERSYCREAARLNGVESLVELNGLFRPTRIRQLIGQRILCVCDCEGFEAEIFNAETVKEVANWDLLIELHGEAAGKLTSLPWPHRLTSIASTPRTGNYPELEGLGGQGKLLSEFRGEAQTWLWCDSVTVGQQ
jgi:hypothetical protein